jgi:LPXTG-motif cell wall-anchored protein
MQSKVDRAWGRFGAPVLVAAIAVFLMAAGLVVGGTADATPAPYPPPPASSAGTAQPAHIHAQTGAPHTADHRAHHRSTANTHANKHVKAHAGTAASVRGTHSTSSHETSSLAQTGYATATAIGIVALLLVGGGVLLYFGRRRQN